MNPKNDTTTKLPFDQGMREYEEWISKAAICRINPSFTEEELAELDRIQRRRMTDTAYLTNKVVGAEE